MSDDESISDDANMSEYCIMAIDDIEGDLQCPFNGLHNDFSLISRRNKELKKRVDSLENVKDRVTLENTLLTDQT